MAAWLSSTLSVYRQHRLLRAALLLSLVETLLLLLLSLHLRVIMSSARATAARSATFTLTVACGSGSGKYEEGTVVPVAANAAPAGFAFSRWAGATSCLADPSAAKTTLSLPAADTYVLAAFAPSSGAPQLLTVVGGSGGGSILPGSVVTITAGAPPAGFQFSRWLGSTATLILTNADASMTTLTMPELPTTITASFTPNQTAHTVTVTRGSGSGSYVTGAVLAVVAEAAGSGSHFTGWSGDTGSLADPSRASTTMTVASSSLSVTATYAAVSGTYAVTVSGGSGSGSYAPGTPLTITADAPQTGSRFTGWSGDIGALADAAAALTLLFVPAKAATVQATYAAIGAGASLVLAVGLERLVADYRGPALRIQRPSDNAQTDVGFASGSDLLDTAAVSAFLGASQGWITRLYAQDGDASHDLTTPLPLSTDSMPTISAVDPTRVQLNATDCLTARNVENPFQYGEGNHRYFVLPGAVSVNRSQMSAFLACRLDHSGCGGGFPCMSLYEVGDPTVDAVDAYVTGSGLQALTHAGEVQLANSQIVPRSQQTVIGLVTAPTATPTLYLDGVAKAPPAASIPASATCCGGYLLAGTGTGLYWGMPLFGYYNFLSFALFSGTVDAVTAAAVSSAMLPRTVPRYSIVADGDSITQGTGAVLGWNMLHHLEPMLSQRADVANLAIYGTTSPSAVGHVTDPTPQTSAVGRLYSAAYTRNIYYLLIGTNDIHGGFNTGAGVWKQVMTALTAAKALGFTTTVATILHEVGESDAAAAEVETFNSLVRAAAGSPYLDAVIDYSADVRLGLPGVYYSAYAADGTHPNNAGHKLMAEIAARVINKFMQDDHAQSQPPPTPQLMRLRFRPSRE